MSDFLTTSPSQLKQELLILMQYNAMAVARGQKRIPAMIWGPSASGKSAIVDEVIQELGYPSYDFRANLHEPTDLLGFPFVTKQEDDSNVTRPTSDYAPFSWLPTGNKPENKNFVIKCEEVPNATPDMQAAMYQMTYDFMVGGHALDDTAQVILLGNRMEDHGNTYDMPEPLKLRMQHFVLESNIDDFARWASLNNIYPMIIAFLRWQPQYLHAIDNDAYTSPTARSWHMLSDRLSMPTPNRMLTVQAHVGIAAARAFLGFEKDFDQIPDMDELLLEPTKAAVPEGALLYAVCSSLIARVSTTNFAAVITYINRIPPDYQIVFFRDVLKVKPELAEEPPFMDWITRNADIGNIL